RFGILARDAVIVVAVSLVAQTKSSDNINVKISPLLDHEKEPLLILRKLHEHVTGFRLVSKQLESPTPLDPSLSIVLTNADHEKQAIAANEFEECFLVLEYTLGLH